VGRDTVTTLAPASIEALRDHGDPKPDTVERNVEEAEAVIAGLADADVEYDDLTATLEHDGVGSFAQSYKDFLATLDKRREQIVS
jgi:transaldolase